MTSYYNDHDPRACDWIEELMRRGLIPAGVVDRRSILDVTPADLVGFTQCHFFAGICGWPLALQMAGWPGDRPVWTGSPPCQPFSAAGKRKGKDDARHLAPHFADLISACRPAVLFGEQVASQDVLGKAAKRSRILSSREPEWAWIDDLFARLEAAHYACVAADLPAACVGAPHIRQRVFFGAADLLANTDDAGLERRIGMPGGGDQRAARQGGVAGRLADANGGDASAERQQSGRQYGQQSDDGFAAGRLADASMRGQEQRKRGCRGEGVFEKARGRQFEIGCGSSPDHLGRPGTLDGFWRDADWLGCRDGKWRPVEPGTFPLAHGLSARVGRLRGYGNAIVPQVAAEFIRAFCEAAVVSGITGEVAE